MDLGNVDIKLDISRQVGSSKNVTSLYTMIRGEPEVSYARLVTVLLVKEVSRTLYARFSFRKLR